MKNVQKNLLIFSLVLLTSLLLVACNSDSSSGDANGKKSKDKDERFKLSLMLNLHTPEIPQDRLEKLLEEKTNTDLDIQWVPDGTYDERVNSAFASGTLPHAFLVKAGQFVQFKEAVRDGQFWEIGPYLDEFENLSKLREGTLNNSMIDGKLYSLYMGRPLSRDGIIYRKDWADKLGINTPKTTVEFYEMLKAFTENDPDGNGKDDTIGLTVREGLGSFNVIASWHGVPNRWGEKEGELLPDFMFPEYIDTLNYFRDLHSNGYMNHDAPVTSKQDQQALLKNGSAGTYIGSMQDVYGMYNDAVALNPDIVFDVHNYVEGPHGEYGVRSIPGYGSLIMFPKSGIESEAELKKVIKFFDYLMSTEGANTLIWGVEGEHYEIVDGHAKVLDQDKFDTEIKPYTPLEIGEPLTNGRYEAFYDYEPATKSNELYIDNDKYVIEDPTVTLDSDTYNKNAGTLDQIIEDATIQYILGNIDETGFKDSIEKWKNAGGNDVIKEYNES
ncbi:extracellular solute-binding protein [Fredinandcohnia onubensis]|uniref:extracellular solute-binding protein n=1 Tax=Fredinandcohnia onubensis TaxID=1571209 RepID=UPI000C0BFB56|nr:extracellular solute-binding protein [Fredinandcohnia onubensis]